MDYGIEAPVQRPETLSEIICFRMKPSEVEKLTRTFGSLGISRSRLIRTVLATGGVIYVGNDLIGMISDYRADVARVGNLLKLIARQLQALEQSPLLNADDRLEIVRLLQRIDAASDELLQIRREIVGLLEAWQDQLEELNRGIF